MYRNRSVGLPFILWLCVVALALSAGTAFAFQAQGVGWEVTRATTNRGRFRPGLTPAGDHLVYVKLFAASKEFAETPLLVVFPGCDEDPKAAGRPVLNLDRIIGNREASPEYNTKWVDPGPRWRVCSPKSAVLVRGGDPVRISLLVDFLRPVSENLSPRLRGFVYQVDRELLNKVQSPVRLAQMLKGEQPVSDIVLDLYYRTNADKRMWYRGGYGDVFGKGDRPEQPEIRPETGDYLGVADQLPVVVSDFRRSIQIPYIEKDGGYDLLQYTVGWARELGSGRAGDQICREDDDFALRRDAAPQIGYDTGPFTLSGIFSTKWTDHSLHPGWGFRVEAWTLEGASWRMLASDWVQSNGTWSLYVGDLSYTGAHLRMLYRSYNDYYKPQDQDGNTYSWRDPDQYNITASFNAGHRYADCDGGDFNGVGELVDAAMYTWSRLYWIGGIDPVHPPGNPGGPINFHYPNTWDDCVGGSGPPWSCSANGSPNIWLIAAHGTRAQVVTHEMGHQLQNKFWGWKQPAGAGGPHGAGSCYPAKLGLALSEGFANFLPGWVGYPDRNVAEGGFATGRWEALELESRNSPPNCVNGWENETWVARTFWDLHDTRTDGDDILWFNHRGAVPAIYLANGVASHGDARDLRDYEVIYRAAASAGHQGFITDIFEQNRN